MGSLEMEKWRKNKCTMTRSNDKLVVGARMLYERKMRDDGEAEKYIRRLVT